MKDEDAVAVALVGITAHLGLFLCANCRPGETVFVNGGTGGVGSMVVQMAKAVGAKVVTTAGSDEKVKQAQALGADLAINYKTDDVAAKVKEFTGGKGVHVWYETLREPDYDRIVDADGAARADRRDGGPAGPAAVPARAVLRQGPVAVRVRDVQHARRRAAALCRGHQPLAGRRES